MSGGEEAVVAMDGWVGCSWGVSGIEWGGGAPTELK